MYRQYSLILREKWARSTPSDIATADNHIWKGDG